MKLDQMFPSKFLMAEDLPRGQNTIVTILKVYPMQGKADKYGDVEVKYGMRLEEFRKPMTLWASNARLIAKALGSEDSDDWAGRRIAVYPSTYLAYGETKPCINVDPEWKDAGPRKPAAGGGGGLVIANDRRAIPDKVIQRFLGLVKDHGGSWDGFLAWLKHNTETGLAMAYGQGMDAIPSGLLPAMKAYLDSIALARLPEPGADEVVDPATGEVVTIKPEKSTTPAHEARIASGGTGAAGRAPPPGSIAAKPARAVPEGFPPDAGDVVEDDIPF